MRCRLGTPYRKAGVLYPAGAVIDLDQEDLGILGPPAEVLTEQHNPHPKPHPKPAPENPDPTGSGAGEPPGRGRGEDTSLRGVLGEMDAADPERNNESWWTREGKPEVSELRRRGHVLSAAGRDREWKRYFESKE